MKSKIVLFSVVAVLVLFAVSAVPSAYANGLDNNKVCFVPEKELDNKVYFEPEDSYGLYCENIPVLIMVDAVNLTTGAGMDIYFDPNCVNITNVDFTGTPYSALTGWTHGGNYVRIAVMGPMDPIQPGTHLIANLTLHCEKETECSSDLVFAKTELLDYDGDPLQNVIWYDGTFSCGEVPCIPSIEVNKTVWDKESQAWVDETTAQMSENVRFRCEIHNDGTCPLTGIVARDILSDSLGYADNATVNGEPEEPTIVTPNEFRWEFPVFVLMPCQTITIEFDTHVIGYGYDCNVQNAIAMWEEIEVSDEDTACVDVPNGQDNEVYFVPEDSYGPYCENIPVLIMVDAVDLTTGAGMDIYFDPNCVNITNVDFTGTPYSALTGWTHEGNYVRIAVMGPMTPIQPGTHLIANLTLHCENETAECSSDLLFKATELLDYDGSPLPNVIWHDGTFTCVDKPDLNVTKITLNCGYLFANESNEICAKIENIGSGDAGAFNVSFDIDGFSTEVGIAGLAAGENTTVCINDTTIRNAGVSVTITVTADCDGEVDESDETNNELILDTTVVNNGYKGKRYTGGEDINTWDTFTLNGNLIYSPGDSYYLSAYSHPDWTEYNVGWTTGDLPIPGTATVTEARLFVPYTWDKAGVMPTSVSMSFNGNLQTLDAHYSDEKGWGTSYPYGMLVYDVTGDFNTAGNVANLTNSCPGGDNVSMRGMLLVVVYADDSEPERTILMNEGFDLLYGGASKCTTPEEATAYAPFGSIDTTEVQQATLITVAPGAGPNEGDLGFNTQMWYNVWNFVGSTQIGIAETDVTAYLQAADNEAYFRSSADYMEASNAFLILEKEAPCPAEYAVYQANVIDPEKHLNELRALRDEKLDDGYVASYYDNSPALTLVLSKADSDLVKDGAKLLSRYSIPVGKHVQGMDVDERITRQDVEEALSFTDRLKKEVMKNRDAIGADSTEAIIDFIDEFEGQVKASEGKTFSAALKSSIYYEGGQLRVDQEIVKE